MKYLSVFFLLMGLIGCQKTDTEPLPEVPSTLYLNSITQKNRVRLYNDGKEITNTDVINRFLKSTTRFTLKDTSFVSDKYIKFVSADSAEIPNLFNSLAVIKNGNQFLFTSTNRLILTKEFLENHVNMAKYRSEVQPVWDGKFSTYYMLVGYGGYSELQLSVFEYSCVQWRTNFSGGYFDLPNYLSKSSFSGIRYNEFDESYLKSVGKNDTLAIQEYFYSFNKR